MAFPLRSIHRCSFLRVGLPNAKAQQIPRGVTSVAFSRTPTRESPQRFNVAAPRAFTTSTARSGSGKFISFEDKGNARMPDTLEHAVGIERAEMEAKRAGICDLFELEVKPLDRENNTRCCPEKIPSVFNNRIVGCICHDDVSFIQWMWVYKGFPKRCKCGYWFELCEGKMWHDWHEAAEEFIEMNKGGGGCPPTTGPCGST